MESQNKFKIVMLGEGRVGKTSLTIKFCLNNFDDAQASTVNATFLEKEIKFENNTQVTLAVWDTAGQEKFHAMAPLYYRDALGAVLVYDVTFKESFLKVEKWVDELRQFGDKNIEIVIAGNKCDMKQNIQISQQEAEEYARSKGAKHFLTSAKQNIGIDIMFSTLAKSIMAKQQAQIKPKKKGGLKIQDPDAVKKNGKKGNDGCC